MNIIPRMESYNPNFYYLLKKDIDNAIYIENEKTLFTNKMNLNYAKRLFKKIKIRDIKEFYNYINSKKPKKIMLDFKGSSINLYNKLNNLTKIEDYGIIIENKRMKKTKEEVRYIKKAVNISKEIFNELDINKGMKENEVEKELKMLAVEKGVELSFPPIVGELSNAKYPHYKTGKKRIYKGVLIDFGIKYKNYCSDITRVVVFDKRSKEYKTYEKLKKIFFEIVDEIKNIKNANELYELSIKTFKKNKVQHPPHLIGHGIGLEVHEKPFPTKDSYEQLVETTMAIEPAYYGRFGIRFEENIYIKSNKVEIL